MAKRKVSIAGAELARLLKNHPGIEISAAVENSEDLIWVYSTVELDVALPPHVYTPLSVLTAQQVEDLGVESIIMEVWVADSPNPRCYSEVGDVAVCGGEHGCSALGFWLAHLRGIGLPTFCHVYDDETDEYGVICALPKKLSPGYGTTHGLWNPDGVAHTCNSFIVFYKVRKPLRG